MVRPKPRPDPILAGGILTIEPPPPPTTKQRIDAVMHRGTPTGDRGTDAPPDDSQSSGGRAKDSAQGDTLPFPSADRGCTRDTAARLRR